MGSGRRGPVGTQAIDKPSSLREGGVTMRDDERRADEQQTDERETYERPTLTPAGSFTKMTGLNGQGPKDTLFKHQLL
jgi:hypothetical protein